MRLRVDPPFSLHPNSFIIRYPHPRVLMRRLLASIQIFNPTFHRTKALFSRKEKKHNSMSRSVRAAPCRLRFPVFDMAKKSLHWTKPRLSKFPRSETRFFQAREKRSLHAWFQNGRVHHFLNRAQASYLLGLLAKIKCSICSYQLNF